MSKTVPDIIDTFGRLSRFGRACGYTDYPCQRAYDMRRRGRIPARYWKSIVQAAEADDLNVTLEMLAAAHAEHPQAVPA